MNPISTTSSSRIGHIAVRVIVTAAMALTLLTATAFVPLASAQPAPPPAPPAAPGPTPPPAPPAAPRRTTLVNPLGTSDIRVLVGRAIYGFMGLSGSFALLMFVYGAFTWVTSAGNPEKITRGKKIFTYAVIGLMVIFLSYAFLKNFFKIFCDNC